MNIMLGNFTIEDMEKRMSIEFPQELKTFMETRHQSNISNGVNKGKWHCYDIPFTLVCGDMETAKTIYKHIKPLSDKITGKFEISIQSH